MSVSIGDRLGRYEVLGPLGSGGMGEVWRARDSELGREVAIKVLPEEVAADPSRLERFGREARALATLSHPNLLTVFDVGLARGRPYSVTELLEGRSLREVLRYGPCSVAAAVAWSLGIARGLAAAHAKAIVHRDLKPDNVFLTVDGRVKVLDFGLAKILLQGSGDSGVPETVSESTEAGTVLGTMGYMAPEQLRGEPVDTRADVFALGCVMYEMLSGRRPFAGGSRAEQVSSVLRDDPAPLGEAIPATLWGVVRRCLEKRPAARYQGAAEVTAALEAVDTGPSGDSPGGALPPVRSAVPSAEPTVAVMPFVNLSGDVDQEYLCDGVAEEILGAISRVRGVRVLARSSSFAFKERVVDPREVGRLIGADHLVEGSVRLLGDRIRISARLVQASTGTQLWADRYDRTFSDVFELQDEVSVEVANQLRTALLEDEVSRLRPRHVPSREAKDLYLRGRYLWYRRREGDLQEAISRFEQAVDKDPEYAEPHAGIAEVFGVLGANAYLEPRLAYARARSEADRVFELDDTIASAHAVNGLILGYHEYRWEAADQAFRRAIEIEPGWGHVKCWYAGFLGGLRRLEEAAAQARQAAADEPMAPVVLALAGANLLNAGVDEGFECFSRALEMDPEHPTVNHFLGMMLVNLGELREAIPHLERGFRAGIVADAGLLGFALSMTGQRDRLEAVENRLDELASERYVSHHARALIELGRGNLEQALDRLEAARRNGEYEVMLLECLTFLAPLRGHPRYRRLLGELGIPEGVVARTPRR